MGLDGKQRCGQGRGRRERRRDVLSNEVGIHFIVLQETIIRRRDLGRIIEKYAQECRKAHQGPDDGRCERGPEEKTMGVFHVRRRRSDAAAENKKAKNQ